MVAQTQASYRMQSKFFSKYLGVSVIIVFIIITIIIGVYIHICLSGSKCISNSTPTNISLYVQHVTNVQCMGNFIFATCCDGVLCF
jgi:hypothetical protein